MPPRPPTPRQVALANLVLPGLGYLALGRRALLGGLLVAYSLITAALAFLYLSILFEHFPHVHPDGYPAIVGAIVLYAFQHATVAVGTALDGRHEAERAAGEGAQGAPGPGGAFANA